MTENGSIASSGWYKVGDSWYEVPAIQSESVNGDDWTEGLALPCRFANTCRMMQLLKVAVGAVLSANFSGASRRSCA